MNRLARLKNLENPPDNGPTKPAKGAFVGFAGACPEPFQISASESNVLGNGHEPANDAVVHDDVFMARVALFTDRGLSEEDAEAIAARLSRRDLEQDERRVCLECLYLSGGMDSRRCSQWRKIGQINGAAIPGELATLLQRCGAFLDRLEAK